MSWHRESSSRDVMSSASPDWDVPLAAPSFSQEEVQSAAEVVRSGWWTYGPVSRELETEFASTLGVEHAVAVSSGTAALQLCLVALEAGPGDEIITPSLTFVAAANSILHTGAVPRFADVAALTTPLVSVETLRRSVGPRTRGLCVMHYGGYPCDMEAVMEFARERGLWVIEDAAHAPGATWKGIPCGAWGDAGCFSFFGNKNITCGEGGMVVTRRSDIADRIRRLRSHGMSSLTWDRYSGHGHSYDVGAAGHNFRLDDIRSAILRVQLRSLERINRLRAERVAWYRRLLEPGLPLAVPFTEFGGESAHHLFTVVLDEGVDRGAVAAHMKGRRVQTSVHYPPIHQFTYYRSRLGRQEGLELTESLGRRLLTLPLYADMSFDQVGLVCESLAEALREA
jgi:dTDP-4-amino-4,6-dideoxygalactose transaminase